MTDQVVYPPRPAVNRATLPPGPPELPVVGQSFRYLRAPIRLMQESATYGDLVTMSVKPALVYLVNHPELARAVFVTHHQKVGRGRNAEVLKYFMGEGLVTADGPQHLRQRRLMQPHFHHRRIAGYASDMAGFAQRQRDLWQDGAAVDLAQEMSGLTLRVVVKTLFGLDLPDNVRRIGDASYLINRYLVSRTNQPPRVRRLFHRLPLPYTLQFRQARALLDDTIYRLIEQRRRHGIDGDDLLSLLLQTRDEDAGSADGFMTDEQVRDESITMFAAGHETTAVGLTWTWYLLATHPAVEARFHAELDAELAGRTPAMADLPRLTYTRQVLDESLRLYPPIWSSARMTFAEFELGGYVIPAGSLLVAPQLIAHRDARWYEAPLEFRPERWTPEFRENLHRFAYYPFGGGPRVCIGEEFAKMEALLILATLGQRWRMRHNPSHKVDVMPLISLRPKGGMPMFLERR